MATDHGESKGNKKKLPERQKWLVLTKVGKALLLIERIISTYLTGFIIVGVVTAVCYELSLRLFLNRSITGLPEVAELMVVVITFTALASLQKENAHITMDTISNRLIRTKAGPFLRLFHSLLSVVLFIFIFYVLISITVEAHELGHTTMSIFMPIWPVFVFVSLGSLVMLIRLCVQMKEGIQDLIEGVKLKENTLDDSVKARAKEG
jgi:TRAP-type C4-dicarboxylate transport system permease small subunit